MFKLRFSTLVGISLLQFGPHSGCTGILPDHWVNWSAHFHAEQHILLVQRHTVVHSEVVTWFGIILVGVYCWRQGFSANCLCQASQLGFGAMVFFCIRETECLVCGRLMGMPQTSADIRTQ
jgi:hypothetical protein